MLRAFHHYVYKDHEFLMSCDGCLEAAGFLCVLGYEGSEYPTCADVFIARDSRTSLKSTKDVAYA